MNPIKPIINNGNTIWRTVVILCMSGLFTTAGWAFVKVRDIPQEYISKIEYEKDTDNFINSINEKLTSLENNINTIFKASEKNMDNRFESLDCRIKEVSDQVDEINTFLRDYYATHGD